MATVKLFCGAAGFRMQNQKIRPKRVHVWSMSLHVKMRFQETPIVDVFQPQATQNVTKILNFYVCPT